MRSFPETSLQAPDSKTGRWAGCIFSALLAASVVAGFVYLRTRTVGTITASTGDLFVVTQTWNCGLDGYITELIHTDASNRVTTHTLDGDDVRSTAVPLSLDEKRRMIRVDLSPTRSRSVPY